MRRVLVFISLLILPCFFACGCSTEQPTKHPTSSPITGATAVSTELPLDGIPNPQGGVLSQATVLSSIGTHAFIGGATTTGQAPQVVTMRQMMSKDAEALLKETVTEDNRPVFFVELRGPFTIDRLNEHNPGSPPVNLVYEVLDAVSGEVLVWGVMDDISKLPALQQTAVSQQSTREGLVP